MITAPTRGVGPSAAPFRTGDVGARVPAVVLLSTYDLGHAPFGLASPAAWLRDAGFSVRCNDLAVEPLDVAAVAAAGLIAIHLPMHTATRLAVRLLTQLVALNPNARRCAYGLYAALNRSHLEALGVHAVLGGEYEAALVEVARLVARGGDEAAIAAAAAAPAELPRLEFRPPARDLLPPLDDYAHFHLPDGSMRLAGYVEASRGCKHRCRHCPVVPVYDGHFRVVPRAVVLEDVRRQVALGAAHVTFGDPDFLNGPGHVLPLVRALHAEHPDLSWDATIKIEHLVRHADLLPELADAGCALITSAAESVDDAVLERLEKGHTRADFERAVTMVRAAGITLQPTFVAFGPWTSAADWAHLLAAVAEMGLIEHVSPIQLVIRLLLPSGSRLLDLDEVRGLAGAFDPEALVHPWRHPSPEVDALQRTAEAMVSEAARHPTPRAETFRKLWALAEVHADIAERERAEQAMSFRLAPVPYLSEPWYC